MSITGKIRINQYVLRFSSNIAVKKGAQKLKNSMTRADVVLCPVRNNSHAACQQVKKLGKKLKKPVYLLPNFSLNAISQVINTPGIEARQYN